MLTQIFNDFFSSWLLIALTIILFLFNSITMYDRRIIQGKRSGLIPMTEPNCPSYVGTFIWIAWIIYGILAILNWKVAIAVWLFMFVFKVLPVLETVGKVLSTPIMIEGSENDVLL